MNSYNSPSSGKIKYQKYSRLTAQIIKSSVKKQILDIRKRKDVAVHELIEQLEQKLIKKANKNLNNTVKSKQNSSALAPPPAKIENTCSTSPIEEIAATVAEGIALADKLMGRSFSSEIDINELLLRLLSSNRSNFESLLLALAQNFDAEALACFGTNLIYGGFVTETLHNSPRCRYIDLGYRPDQNTFLKLQQIIKNDLMEGRRVCIIHGKQLLCDNIGRFCRSFSDTAFILIDSDPIQHAFQGIYNVLYIPETTKNVPLINSKSSILSGVAVFSPNFPNADENQTNFNRISTSEKGNYPKLQFSSQSSSSNAISSLFKFLTAPSLPIKSNAEEFYSALCYIERLVSNGQNNAPIKDIVL